MMKVYHTSQVVVDTPDTVHSRNYLDFGRGFYLTPLKAQAVKYAERFKRRGREARLNIYELNEDFNCYRLKRFDAYNEEWLDYVIKCRQGEDDDLYDIIIGGIADDKVFRTLDLFFSGDISKDEALKRLVFEHPNMQICIRSEHCLKNNLTFLESVKL